MKYEKPEIVHLADAATAVQSADALKQQVVSDGIPASQHPATTNAYEADE